MAQRVLTLATDSEDVVPHTLVNQRLGVAYMSQGDYRRAIDCLGQTVASLEGARRHERFGTSTVIAASSCAWLAWGHAELGMFPEGTAFGDEGLCIAEAVNHPASLLVASWGSGLLALRQGDLPRALALLERAMGICQDADIPTFFPGLLRPWARRMLWPGALPTPWRCFHRRWNRPWQRNWLNFRRSIVSP